MHRLSILLINFNQFKRFLAIWPLNAIHISLTSPLRIRDGFILSRFWFDIHRWLFIYIYIIFNAHCTLCHIHISIVPMIWTWFFSSLVSIEPFIIEIGMSKYDNESNGSFSSFTHIIFSHQKGNERFARKYSIFENTHNVIGSYANWKVLSLKCSNLLTQKIQFHEMLCNICQYSEH